MKYQLRYLSVLAAAVFAASPLTAQEGETASDDAKQEALQVIELADGTMKMSAPESWEKIEPKFSMIDVEMNIPAAEGDDDAARLTIMSAGGSIDANIDRWKGQFSSPEGGPASDVTVEETEVAGMKTHMVDIKGTFADRPGGPTAPPTLKKNYRMLAAIIESGNNGTWFIKFYGSEATMEANAEKFEAFVKSLEVTD